MVPIVVLPVQVTPDDIIFVNQMPGVEVNEVLSLGRVMLLGSRAQTVIGRPYVPGASVIVAVEEHFRDGKVRGVYRKELGVGMLGPCTEDPRTAPRMAHHSWK